MLGISLWIGSLAWSGFVMTRTVLNPDRSEDIADALLEDEAVRAQLEANIAGGVAAALPPGAPVDRAAIDAGAATALDSPAVEAVIRDALVRTHQGFLGEGDVPRSVESDAFGGSARDALVAERPELDGVLPAAPSIEVPLPTERLPNLGPVRRGLSSAVPLLALVSAIGVLLSLVVTTDRPRVIRRAGVWAVGLSAVVLLFAYGVPALAHELAPDQAQIVAALVSALAAATRGPALALAGAGLAAIVVASLWRSSPAAVPAAAAASASPARPPARNRPRRRDLPTPGRRPARPAPAAPRSVPASDPTSVWANASAAATRVDAPRPAAARAGARWVPGTGWVHDGTGEIPEGARWVPGVGYVVDEA
jgi:hypothetical protein